MNLQNYSGITVFDHKLTTEEMLVEALHIMKRNNAIFSTRSYKLENIEKFTGKPLDGTFDIMSPIAYVAFLEKCLMEDNFYDLPNELVKDLVFANKKGIVCFYLTTILNMLLRDVHGIRDVQMVQGLYHYTTTFFGFTAPTSTTGVHAFSLVNGSVVDVCFYPQNMDYPTEECAMVGEVPEDVELYGWTETIINEEMYIDLFSKKNHCRSMAHLKLCHMVAYQDFLSEALASI